MVEKEDGKRALTNKKSKSYISTDDQITPKLGTSP